MASKKQGTSASACNHIDFVSAAGTSRPDSYRELSGRVAQNFISGFIFSLIDFSRRLRNCLGCKPCPEKPLSWYKKLFRIWRWSGKATDPA